MNKIQGMVRVFLAPLMLSAQSVTLATRNVEQAATIVIPAAASPSQRHAAEELQRFTEQLTGVKLALLSDEAPLPPRAILLGETRHSAALLGQPPDMQALGSDGFRIVTRAPHLLVLGSPIRGTLYGVYEILERFGGCGWYSSWHSVVPRLDSLSVPEMDETQLPAFAMREPYWYDMFNGDLAARNKVNGNGMRLEAKHGGKGFRFGAGLFCHTFERLCPPNEFFESHPEYFSEINGKRLKAPSQLCLTNPDVLKIVTQRLLEHMRKDPEAKLFSVSQNDWYNFCTCPKCKALDEREDSHAGTLITFVNQVAEAVEKEFPDAWIETLAYQYTRKPPKTVRPRHNVVPRLCSIECDFALPLASSPFEQNKRFVDEIRSWSAISKNLFVWDYTTNFRGYITPFPNVLALQENARLFRDNKVVALFEQGAYQGRHADFAELKAWLLAKWLWNPELPMEPLLQQFFTGYYGAAAPLVRNYFNEVHQFYGVATNAPLKIFYDIKEPVIPAAFHERAVKMWQAAEAAVKDDPSCSYNVRMGAVPAMYAHLSHLPLSERKRIWVTEAPQKFAVPETHRALAGKLVAYFDEAKDLRLSERKPRHDEMIEVWRYLATPFEAPAEAGKLSAVVEDKLLRLAKRGAWGETVADPLAENGSAMKLFNSHYEWCTTLPLSWVAFDEGRRYRLRMRVRVEREPGQEGEAFWSGVYDPANKRGCGGCDRKAQDVAEGYQWYTVTEWEPKAEHYFWIGPGRYDKDKLAANPAIKAIFIDKLEITRVD